MMACASRMPILCDSCQKRNLKEIFFPVERQENGQPKFYRFGDDIDFTSMVRNYFLCVFCRLVMQGLSTNTGFTENIKEALGSKVIAREEVIGMVSWSPPENEAAGIEPHLSAAEMGKNGWRARWVRRVNFSLKVNGKFWQAGLQVSGRGMCHNRDAILLGRSMTASHIDKELVLGWRDACVKHHDVSCQPVAWTDMNMCGVRMIDVERLRVLPAPVACQYLALSYCWGDPQTVAHYALTAKTFEHLTTEGALSDENAEIPKTIRDAMVLTQRLGYRYLWVDALCIQQDDADDKRSQLRLMNRIYRLAIMTIAAAAGDDAWSGLPGIREGSRPNHQYEEQCDGMVLTTVSTGYIASLGTLAWSHRAWTLQERNLSSRLLVFTPRQLFWECNSAMWNEETQFECFDADLHVDRSVSIERLKKPDKGLSPLQKYSFMLAQYTTRKLSYPSDALNAVSALLEDMSFPGGFWWGLPVSVLDTALLWHFGVYQEAPKPRRREFPTWCWAAWEAVAAASVGGPYDAGFEGKRESGFKIPQGPVEASWVHGEVAWHRIASSGHHWETVSNSSISHSASRFNSYSISHWEAQDLPLLLETTLDRLSRADIPPAHALVFCTQSVSLPVDRTRHPENPSAMAVRDHQGTDVGHINVTPEWRALRPDHLDFILISRNLRWKVPYLDLMCVETVAEGLSSRVQLIRNATITDEVWETLRAEWTLVTLV